MPRTHTYHWIEVTPDEYNNRANLTNLPNYYVSGEGTRLENAVKADAASIGYTLTSFIQLSTTWYKLVCMTPEKKSEITYVLHINLHT